MRWGSKQHSRASEILPTSKSGATQTLNTHLSQQGAFIGATRAVAREQELTLQHSGEARQLAGTRGSFPPFTPRASPRQTALSPFAHAGLPLPAPSPPSAAAGLGPRQAQLPLRWHGCSSGAGRALVTHPIGIRRLHWLFIGPHRPQKALGLAFSPSLPPSRSLALAQHRRGSKEMLSVNQPVQARRSQAQQNFCPSASGFSLNKLFPACRPFALVFFPPFQPGFLSCFAAFFFFPLPLSLRCFTFQFLALAWLFLSGAGYTPETGRPLC